MLDSGRSWRTQGFNTLHCLPSVKMPVLPAMRSIAGKVPAGTRHGVGQGSSSRIRLWAKAAELRLSYEAYTFNCYAKWRPCEKRAVTTQGAGQPGKFSGMRRMSTCTAGGLFDTQSDVNRAISALRDQGFSEATFTIIGREGGSVHVSDGGHFENLG